MSQDSTEQPSAENTPTQASLVNARRRLDGTEPVTDFDSKTVMLRAERHDPLRITEIVESAVVPGSIPEIFVVSRRADTYYGPKLVTEAQQRTFCFTAPGPDAHILLWELTSSNGDGHQRWTQLAEVKVDFDGEPPAYNICAECGEPIQTAVHERLSLLGRCRGTDTS